MNPTGKCALAAAVGLAVLTSAGCRQDMFEQPRLDPLEPSVFFADGRASRPLAAGTVARGELREDEAFYTGMVKGELVTAIPVKVTRERLERGRDRFNIHCTPCHDYTGNGNGMIPQRGLKPPPSYHIQRLREIQVGHFFDVMTRGFGAMIDLSDRLTPDDRWAIAAYIRALQLSQNATMNDVPEEFRKRIGDQPLVPGAEEKTGEAAHGGERPREKH